MAAATSSRARAALVAAAAVIAIAVAGTPGSGRADARPVPERVAASGALVPGRHPGRRAPGVEAQCSRAADEPGRSEPPVPARRQHPVPERRHRGRRGAAPRARRDGRAQRQGRSRSTPCSPPAGSSRAWRRRPPPCTWPTARWRMARSAPRRSRPSTGAPELRSPAFAPPDFRDGQLSAMVFAAGHVVIAGAPPFGPGPTLGAYDATTGAPIWRDELGWTAPSMVTDGSRLFLAVPPESTSTTWPPPSTRRADSRSPAGARGWRRAGTAARSSAWTPRTCSEAPPTRAAGELLVLSRAAGRPGVIPAAALQRR